VPKVSTCSDEHLQQILGLIFLACSSTNPKKSEKSQKNLKYRKIQKLTKCKSKTASFFEITFYFEVNFEKEYRLEKFNKKIKMLLKGFDRFAFFCF